MSETLSMFEKSFWGPDFSPAWYMTNFERLVFSALVERVKPRLAIEIGSRAGGSLQILTRHCRRVACVDIDETLPARLADRFSNVTYHIGDSRIVLPKLLDEFQQSGEMPEFIHIDGDHTPDGAASDLRHSLSIQPQKRTWILMHDTFNPDVRAGVRSLDMNSFSYLHFADIDFAPGILHPRDHGRGELWGGFALFILEPEKRHESIQMSQLWQNMLDNLMPTFMEGSISNPMGRVE